MFATENLFKMTDFNKTIFSDFNMTNTLNSEEFSALDLYSHSVSPTEEDELISEFRESILDISVDDDDETLTDEEVNDWMQGILPEDTVQSQCSLIKDEPVPQTPAVLDDFAMNPTPIGQQGYELVNKVPLDNLMAMQESLKLLLKPLQDQLVESKITTTPTFVNSISPYASSATASATATSSDDDDDASNSTDPSDAWNDRFQELLDYKTQYGHTNVPYHWPDNRPLSQWVKRQRHQYKLKQEGRHSNLSQERQERLNLIGFLWDSRAAHWEDRWEELRAYAMKYGNVQVSKRTPKYRPLAVWLKRQRQYARLFLAGKSSMGMTSQRIEKLLELGVPLNLNQGKIAQSTIAKRR